MFNTRGELQASVEHLTDEHREPLREAQVRAQAVQTCGFNPSMQRIDEISQPVYRSLVSFADAH